MGHLADLRGDRGQGRHGRLLSRTTATSSRSSPATPPKQAPLPIKAWGRAPHEAVVVEPSRDARLPHRGRQRPDRAALPLDRPGGLPPQAPHRRTLKRRRRAAGGPRAADRGRQRPARPGLRHRRPDRPPVPDPLGHACPTGRPRRPRCASSSTPARSPTPRSSRGPGATRTACTSSPASPSPPATCRPTPPSTTGSSGTTSTPSQTLTLMAYFPYNERLHTETARLGAGPRPQPRPRVRRPRRLPRVAVRQPGAHRGRQHGQPPAQLEPRDGGPGDRPQPHRPGAELRWAATSTAR